MSRKRSGKSKVKALAPDPVFNNLMVARLINRIMIDGKKTVAQRVIYASFEIMKQKTGQEGIKVFESAIANVGPKVEVRPRRVGGASYQVPTEVRGDRKVALAIRWILAAAKKLPNREFHTFAQKLAQEVVAASKGEGEAIKKRDAVHKMAEANRAFAHFRW
jgi:small subunit ribosomal protein S7